MTRTLGYEDEPRTSGAVVAVHFGDYLRQEIWVASGSNIGGWYCLGGESGRGPRIVDDTRNELAKISEKWQQPEGTIPRHPDWADVLARGPVTLLFPGDDAAYAAGWRAGRHALWGEMENSIYDDPPGDADGRPDPDR